MLTYSHTYAVSNERTALGAVTHREVEGARVDGAVALGRHHLWPGESDSPQRSATDAPTPFLQSPLLSHTPFTHILHTHPPRPLHLQEDAVFRLACAAEHGVVFGPHCVAHAHRVLDGRLATRTQRVMREGGLESNERLHLFAPIFTRNP